MKTSISIALFLFLAWFGVCHGTPPDYVKQIEQLVAEVRSLREECRTDKEKTKAQLDRLTSDMESVKAYRRGVSYVHWGRTGCNATTLVELQYTGYASGTRNNQTGSGSNMLCLPEEPQWDVKFTGTLPPGWLYGVEYQFGQDYAPNGPFSADNNRGESLHDHPAPCSVCYVPTRTAKLMIPGRKECPTGWTKEYGGYVMAARHNYQKSSYNCWDAAPETAAGGYNQNQALVYPVKVGCGTLPCHDYDQWEVTCVVCTR